MRSSNCPNVFIRDACGAAVKAGKAKICELERAKVKTYVKKMKGAMKFFICGKREGKQRQGICHMSNQHSGCQSFHFLFYIACVFFIANLLFKH